jgi:DNA-binding IclR family transcriptional regulator
VSASDSGARARVPTLRKMRVLLEAFTPARPTWRVLELSREIGWDPATTHRFLRALVEIGMLESDEDLTYRIGILPLKLAAVSGSAAPGRRELLARVAAIAEETGLTTQVGVLDEGRVAIVASEESRGALNAAALLGERLPLHATAGGKVILAQLPDDEVEALLPATLPSFTDHTITDRAAVLEQVRTARETGIAHAESELSLGLHATAVPLARGLFGSQPAALTCAGLSRDLVPDQWDAAEQILLQQAGELSGHHTSLA